MNSESENKTDISSYVYTDFMSDPVIMEFFNTTMLDPRKFMLNAIQNYKNTMSWPNDIKVISAEQNNNIMMKQSLVDALQRVNQIVSKISFHDSEKILALHCTIKEDANILICPLCSVFRVTTKKGLAAHKRKCEKNVNPTLV